MRGRDEGRRQLRWWEPKLARMGDPDGKHLLTQIQVALGLTPRQLANALGVPLAEVLDRDATRGMLSESDLDPFWSTLGEYVDRQLGAYMAVRELLQRKQRIERANRIARRRRIAER